MTPERAKELIKVYNFLHTNMEKGKQPPFDKVTEEEHEFVMRVWRAMDGNSTFMSALYAISKQES